MYKVGNKVETPLGIGVINTIGQDLKWNNLYFVNLGKLDVDYVGMGFKEKDLKPYKSAHDKLIAMGYTLDYVEKKYKKQKSHILMWTRFDKGVEVEHGIMTNVTITLELSRIFNQYLEELEK